MSKAPKLHNAMWPGLVGKGDEEGQEPPISLEHMLDLTAAAEVDGQKFDGIDYFLFLPHTNPEATDDELKGIADLIVSKGFDIGSLVAPIWPGTVGDSAMGTAEQRGKFLDAVKMACRIAKIFNEHGARKYGVIRIDSAEFGVEKWGENSAANTAQIVETFKEAATIAADHGERLAAEGEICWAGMHSWKDMLDVLEGVGMPETLGFQADLAHTYLYTMGYNAPEHALLQDGYSAEEFQAAYGEMTDKLRPWTIDFHIAQNDGEVHGAHGVPLALAILGALDALFCGAARPRWRPGPWATALLYHACGPAQRSVGGRGWGGGGAVLLHYEVGGVCGMRAA